MKCVKIMLVFNLTKWCIHKILEFYPLHNHFKYVLCLSLTTYAVAEIMVDVSKMGVGKNA